MSLTESALPPKSLDASGSWNSDAPVAASASGMSSSDADGSWYSEAPFAASTDGAALRSSDADGSWYSDEVELGLIGHRVGAKALGRRRQLELGVLCCAEHDLFRRAELHDTEGGIVEHHRARIGNRIQLGRGGNRRLERFDRWQLDRRGTARLPLDGRERRQFLTERIIGRRLRGVCDSRPSRRLDLGSLFGGLGRTGSGRTGLRDRLLGLRSRAPAPAARAPRRCCGPPASNCSSQRAASPNRVPRSVMSARALSAITFSVSSSRTCTECLSRRPRHP